jgi:hypothetical protein
MLHEAAKVASVPLIFSSIAFACLLFYEEALPGYERKVRRSLEMERERKVTRRRRVRVSSKRYKSKLI